MRPMLFGKYCLLERISVGGMAEVFRAKPFDAPNYKGYLALKRILPHLAEDDEFIKMFVDEAKLTVQLQHPNIVRIYELGHFQSSHYILMEYISGKDLLALQKTMRRQREVIPIDQSIFIARELARGLHFVHHKRDADGNPLNIIHRDVSPQNVLIDYRGNVKIIDFGIAKAAVQSTRTQVGVLKGKMGYMSPEQVRGEVIDYRSDVFAIGTVLWEMLTNRRLFHGDNEFETMQRVREADVQPPSTKNEAIPPQVDDLVMRALTADPEDRYESAGAFADVLDAWLEHHPYDAESLSVWMRTVYADDLDEEKSKRAAFAEIVTSDDVRRIQQQQARQESEAEPHTLVGESGDVTPDSTPQAASDLRAIDTSDLGDRGVGGAEANAPQPSDDLDESEELKTEIWDADILPEEGQDLAEFAAQHTVVQAGGFDASLVEDGDGVDTMQDDVKHRVPEPTPMPHADTSVDGMPKPIAGDLQPTPPLPGVGPTPVGQPVRPAKTGPGSTHHGTHPPVGALPPPRAFYIVAGLSILLALAGVVSLAALLLFDLGGGEASTEPAVAAVVVNATPPTGLEILLDGKRVGSESPQTIEDVSIGPHVIEVKSPEYIPVRQRIDVKAGITPVEVRLEPRVPPTGTIVVRLPDEPQDRDRIALYVDGERQIVQPDGNPQFALPVGRHLLEAVHPDYRPWSSVTQVEADVRREELVTFNPIPNDLEIQVNSRSSVRLDGKHLGRGTVIAESLDPHQIHEVRVMVRSQGISSWKSAVGFPEIGEPTLVVDFDRPLPPSRRERDFGWLQVSTGDDWWEVLVDGVSTGLVTPIDVDSRIPIAAGKHKITLRRGDSEHQREVRIVQGETFLLREEFEFRWSADESG